LLKVKQFRYGTDNLGYLIYGQESAMVIDGGAVREMLSFATQRKLTIRMVANTHDHPDHTMGNIPLVKASGARFLSGDCLASGAEIDLETSQIHVYHTPGHTNDSVCFHVGDIIITGDTLFNGTIGNCFSGSIEAFYRSIKMIMALAGKTVVYAGHDYVRDSMAFARYLEPDNVYIDRFLNAYDPDHVFSTLDDEFRINPYFRFNVKNIICILKKHNLPTDTEWQRWQSLMTLG
jgi:hydroxyacylglutathione hydrolase